MLLQMAYHFFFWAEQYWIVCMYHVFIYLSASRYLGCFGILAVVNPSLIPIPALVDNVMQQKEQEIESPTQGSVLTALFFRCATSGRPRTEAPDSLSIRQTYVGEQIPCSPHSAHWPQYRAGLLILGAIDTLGWIILCFGAVLCIRGSVEQRLLTK